jgi:FkbM family methyltransferase
MKTFSKSRTVKFRTSNIHKFPRKTLSIKSNMKIVNSYGKLIDIERIEKPEQDLAKKFILENDVVLELGARYGSVSCIINSKLNNKNNQVVVEPDARVWEALEKNKISNNCEFNIIKGFISNKKLGLINLESDYGTTCIEKHDTNIPSYTLDEITQKYNLKFNVLVADCEGFLETFFDENPNFYDNLRLIIFEADYPEKCNYNKIRDTLRKKQFKMCLSGHQNVWMKQM